MLYCSYYQANVVRQKMWFVVAAFRSFEHLSFDRAFDKQQCIFEFFVPQELEHDFVAIISHFVDHKIMSNVTKLPNRFQENF